MSMHVAIPAWRLADGPSGANRRLIEMLRAVGDELDPDELVTVLHRRGEVPDELPRETAENVRWLPVAVPAGPAWRRALAERRILPGLLREIGATVCDLATLPVPARLPCPAVLTIHDLRALDHVPGRRHPAWLAGLALRASLRRAQHVLVPSGFTARRLAHHVPEAGARCEVLPGGVAEAWLSADPEPGGSRPWFLHVGHLEPRKNLLMLVSAYAEFLHDHRGPPDEAPLLVLAGRDAGAGAAIAERAAFLDVTPHLRRIGVVSDADLLRLYRGALAVLVPSLYEGFGQPALEALAVGTPTLVADQGALPEVVADAGEVLPADEPARWAMEMRRFAALRPDPSAIAWRKARARHFAWAGLAARLVEVWREVGSRPGPMPR